jgi:hypothetical protein
MLVKTLFGNKELWMYQTLAHMFWTYCKKPLCKKNNILNFWLDNENLGMYQKLANTLQKTFM